MDIFNKNFSVKAMNEKGEFEAVIATLNVVDLDNDITISGAFGTQDVQIQPAHDSWSPSLGKAVISEDGDNVIAKGRFNLKNSVAQDWYESIKFDLDNGTPLQEWSYGFRIVESKEETRDGERVRILEKLNVFEISPVLRGAGIGTRTVDVKSAGLHKTGMDDGVWDRLAVAHAMKKDQGDDYYRKVFACKSGSGWYLPHHQVSAKGVPGDASLRACLHGIAFLNGIFGPVGMNEATRKAAHKHIAGHLEDANIGVPALVTVATFSPSLKLADQIRFALWDVEAGVKRASDVLDLRREDPRRLGSDSVKQFGDLHEALGGLAGVAKALADLDKKNDEPSRGDLDFARYQKQQAGALGLTG